MDKEDLRKAMEQAQAMQLDLVRAQAELTHSEIQGKSKNSKVSIIMSGQGDIKSVKIDPLILADGLAVLEQSVLEAFKNATERAANITKERLAQISKRIGL